MLAPGAATAWGVATRTMSRGGAAPSTLPGPAKQAGSPHRPDEAAGEDRNVEEVCRPGGQAGHRQAGAGAAWSQQGGQATAGTPGRQQEPASTPPAALHTHTHACTRAPSSPQTASRARAADPPASSGSKVRCSLCSIISSSPNSRLYVQAAVGWRSRWKAGGQVEQAVWRAPRDAVHACGPMHAECTPFAARAHLTAQTCCQA